MKYGILFSIFFLGIMPLVGAEELKIQDPDKTIVLLNSDSEKITENKLTKDSSGNYVLNKSLIDYLKQTRKENNLAEVRRILANVNSDNASPTQTEELYLINLNLLSASKDTEECDNLMDKYLNISQTSKIFYDVMTEWISCFPLGVSPNDELTNRVIANFRVLPNEGLVGNTFEKGLLFFLERNDIASLKGLLSKNPNGLTQANFQFAYEQMNSEKYKPAWKEINDLNIDSNFKVLLLHSENINPTLDESILMPVKRIIQLSKSELEPSIIISGNNTSKIGVLLPFSYIKFRRYVNDIMKGILIAMEQTKSSTEFVFADTELRPEIARKRMTEMVYTPGMLGIIGPLSKNNTEAVEQLAHDENISVFSLSRSAQTSFDNVLKFHDDSDARTELAIDYFASNLGNRKFGIITTDGSSEINIGRSLQAEINQKRGNVLFNLKVSRGAKDFREVFQKITGTFFYDEDGEKIKTKNINPDLIPDTVFLVLDPAQKTIIVNYFQAYYMQETNIVFMNFSSSLGNIQQQKEYVYFVDISPKFKNEVLEPLRQSYFKFSNYESIQNPNEFVIYGYLATKRALELVKISNNDRSEFMRLLKNGFSNSNNNSLRMSPDGDVSTPFSVYKMVGRFPEKIYP